VDGLQLRRLTEKRVERSIRNHSSGTPLHPSMSSISRPTPLDEAVVLRARVKESIGKKTILMCSLFAKGEECAVPFMTFYEFIKDRKEEK
jgi:hypothetical protein